MNAAFDISTYWPALNFQFLRLVRYLIMYGFLGSKEELQQIMPPVINLINGRNDVPFPPDVGVGKNFVLSQVKYVRTLRRRCWHDWNYRGGSYFIRGYTFHPAFQNCTYPLINSLKFTKDVCLKTSCTLHPKMLPPPCRQKNRQLVKTLPSSCILRIVYCSFV